MQRVVNSEVFRRSPALRAFLLYITERVISGRTEELKEQSIGAEVLGRKPNYNPADDNIVRVRAHELRGRLEKYFSSEGADEAVVITMPRGGYAPEFVPRKAEQLEEARSKPQTGEDVPQAAREDEASAEVEIIQKPALRHWLAFAAVLLVAVAASVAITRSVLQARSLVSSARPTGAIADFWGQFFEKPNEELKVVYADTSFALWQDLNGKTLDLGDYLNRKYYGEKGNKLFNVVMRRVTSPADMAISVHLSTIAEQFGGQENPQFARDVEAAFFHQGNVVLIGSHRSDPWVAVYEPNLNFTLDQDQHSGAPLFRNRTPQAHEDATYGIPDMYDTQRSEEKTYPSYGVVALLKGCGDHGLTVLVEGLNTQATQAAGDLVSDPQRMDMLLRSIGHKPGTSVAPFEALFQVISLPGGYDNPRVIAYRLRPPEACVGG
ncbi:MAG: hypothetical protein P4K93_11980 [Terracidiphilus sp.]|nr:hypothetical protein [Terracidiphilus sp.]MDR3798869.1 hypothetical protein [Terracidiphilus sp.]